MANGINIENVLEIMKTAQGLDYDIIADALEMAKLKMWMAADLKVTGAKLSGGEPGDIFRDVEKLVEEASKIAWTARNMKRLRKRVNKRKGQNMENVKEIMEIVQGLDYDLINDALAQALKWCPQDAASDMQLLLSKAWAKIGDHDDKAIACEKKAKQLFDESGRYFVQAFLLERLRELAGK